MSQFKVEKYQTSNYEQWNDFIAQAKNATFLFHRDFMEYHQDRFEDYSLMVYDSTKLVAVLPANRVADKVHSHQGLTYGGLVYQEGLKLGSVLQVFHSVLSYFNTNGIPHLLIKLIPTIYHLKPAQEIDYALFLLEAKLVRRDTLAVLDMLESYVFSKLRKRGIQKAIKNQLVVKEEDSFESFWNQILIPNLENKHQVEPVHTVAEITRLKQLFPENIRQFNVYHGEEIVAGTTIFETHKTVHCQYISKLITENNLGSLDFLYQYLISERYKNKRFFDFGISNECQGQKLNEGLSKWKESFGASTIVHDFYEVETAKYVLLEKCIL
ncbi:GNAT family N-acetyltransferase [Flavobacterium faecale]|uniref:GNAT family N-acetyltransferase n=1 Tax=Flavobacterium faecale TaxID=1355330 RepID=UPI003AAFAC52